MVDYLRTTQVGSRFIRDFIWKGQARRVVTETANGKTFLQIFSENGDKLVDTVKKISKEQVGGKSVITKTRVTDKYGFVDLQKTINDRVYTETGNGGNKLVGTRSIFYKDAVTGEMKYKTLSTDNLVTDTSYRGGMRDERDIVSLKPKCGTAHIDYNNLGLPKPQAEALENVGFVYLEDDSLYKMRKWFQKKHPNQSYAPKIAGLDSLNEKVHLNNLDRYI